MTWMLYQQYVDSLTGYEKKRFLTDAEDFVALRILEKDGFKEGDLSTGGPR